MANAIATIIAALINVLLPEIIRSAHRAYNRKRRKRH